MNPSISIKAPLLSVTELSVSYTHRSVFNGVSFDLYPQERLALVGANGAGKSTLLRTLIGLNNQFQGQIVGFGQRCRQEREFQQLRKKVGFLFQDSDDQLFCPTVLEDVAFGPLNLGLSADAAQRKALQVLASLGMIEFADRITYRLSGGEKRMIALATVLAMEPEVLLLDEPTNGLDESAQQRLLAHLDGLSQAMIVVSHDRSVLERLATRAVLLEGGQLTKAVMHRHPHEHLHVHAEDRIAAGIHEQEHR
ncbi:energy-coupling factor ABC transporter ATP-binding protein [Shewanella mangrovi]|uniref:energy-coupling factor ABC transporter ATP-binding protein n=1 Tax=Shewanella mangrovi TaxID=1515746 RepID=UPI000AAF3BFB|nr:ABC transporter ATP-binding protein [Shewanella mangrovi]